MEEIGYETKILKTQVLRLVCEESNKGSITEDVIKNYFFDTEKVSRVTVKLRTNTAADENSPHSFDVEIAVLKTYVNDFKEFIIEDEDKKLAKCSVKEDK